jgi:AcrR family transcriptional regulator
MEKILNRYSLYSVNLMTGEEMRYKVLNAVIKIVQQDGWQAVSMRKIAVIVKCTAPAIYQYFKNKEAIKQAIARLGYLRLASVMEDARKLCSFPLDQLEHMWLAYETFARTEKVFYQVMFGIEAFAFKAESGHPENEVIKTNVIAVIKSLPLSCPVSNDQALYWYHIMWAFAHGLSTLYCNSVLSGSSRNILTERIRAIVNCG